MYAKVAPRTPTLRDARKSRTRSALRDAALQLFAMQGYEATSTEEISEKAGVSPRTFFRYFPTKETVLFARKDLWFESLAEIYCNQPASLSDVEAICAALVEVAPGLMRSRDMLHLYEQSIASSLTLRGMRLDHDERNAQELAVAIASRRGLKAPDETCIYLGSIGVHAHRRALAAWLAGPKSLDLAGVIQERFRLLAAPFAPADAARDDEPKQTRRAAKAAPDEAKPAAAAPKRAAPRPAFPAPVQGLADDDEAQRIALEELRALNRRVRSASRRQGLAGVSRLLRRTRNIKLIYDRPPIK